MQAKKVKVNVAINFRFLGIKLLNFEIYIYLKYRQVLSLNLSHVDTVAVWQTKLIARFHQMLR
jgi:hypothetical protein